MWCWAGRGRGGSCPARNAGAAPSVPQFLFFFLSGRGFPRLQTLRQSSLSGQGLSASRRSAQRGLGGSVELEEPAWTRGSEGDALSSSARRELGSKIKQQSDLTCKELPGLLGAALSLPRCALPALLRQLGCSRGAAASGSPAPARLAWLRPLRGAGLAAAARGGPCWGAALGWTPWLSREG